MIKKLIKWCSVGVLIVPSAIMADHITQEIWIQGGIEFQSQSAACGNIPINPDTATVDYDNYISDPDNIRSCIQITRRCENTFNGSIKNLTPCNGVNEEIVERETVAAIGYTTRVLEHGVSACEAIVGQTFQATFGDGGFPPSRMCGGLCMAEVTDGGCLGEYCSGTYEYIDEECAAAEPPAPDITVTTTQDGTNTETEFVNGNGSDVNTYPAPDEPPDDADPDTEGNQPPEPSATVTTENGTTIQAFPMEGGGTLYVVTDADGKVTFTDLRPTTGSGQYVAPSGGSPGGTTSGTDPDGSTDGTTGGTSGGTSEENPEEDQGMSSGGFDCEVAPSCSGKAIECMIVRQNWYNRCENEVVREILETPIENEEIIESSEAGQVMSGIQAVEDAVSDLEGGQAEELGEAVNIDVGDIKSRLAGVGGLGSCNLSNMDVDVMGVVMPFGTRLCENWGIFQRTAEFLLWAFTAITIFAMYANAMRQR